MSIVERSCWNSRGFARKKSMRMSVTLNFTVKTLVLMNLITGWGAKNNVRYGKKSQKVIKMIQSKICKTKS